MTLRTASPRNGAMRRFSDLDGLHWCGHRRSGHRRSDHRLTEGRDLCLVLLCICGDPNFEDEDNDNVYR